MFIVSVTIIAALVFYAIGSYPNRIERLREQGLYPQRGQGTEEDVRRILATGDKIGAIRLYRENTGKSLKESKDAVEAMKVTKNN